MNVINAVQMWFTCAPLVVEVAIEVDTEARPVELSAEADCCVVVSPILAPETILSHSITVGDYQRYVAQ